MVRRRTFCRRSSSDCISVRMIGSSAEKRLVHQQDRGVRCQRPGQPHALLHPAGEFVRVAIAPPGQAHLLQRLGCLCLALSPIDTGQLQAQGRVVQHRHMGHQGKRLETPC